MFNFGYGTHIVSVNKDVKIRGYFAKPEGVREQKSSRNTGLE